MIDYCSMGGCAAWALQPWGAGRLAMLRTTLGGRQAGHAENNPGGLTRLRTKLRPSHKYPIFSFEAYILVMAGMVYPGNLP